MDQRPELLGTVFQHIARVKFPVAVPSVHRSVLGCHSLLTCLICGSVLGCPSAATTSCELLSLGLDVCLHGGHVFPGPREAGY